MKQYGYLGNTLSTRLKIQTRRNKKSQNHVLFHRTDFSRFYFHNFGKVIGIFFRGLIWKFASCYFRGKSLGLVLSLSILKCNILIKRQILDLLHMRHFENCLSTNIDVYPVSYMLSEMFTTKQRNQKSAHRWPNKRNKPSILVSTCMLIKQNIIVESRLLVDTEMI